VIRHKVGDRVEAGEGLFTVHANDREKLETARKTVSGAYTWSDEPVEPLPLFFGVIPE
jgi:thymidine phosphorylase